MNILLKRVAILTSIVLLVLCFASCKKMESDLIGELKADNGTFQWYDLEWGQSINSVEQQINYKLEKEPFLTTDNNIDYEKDEYEFAGFYPKEVKNATVKLYDCVGKKSFGFSNNELISVSLEFLSSDNSTQALESTVNKMLERITNLYGKENDKGGFEKGTDGKSSEVYYWNSETSSTRLGLAVNKLNDQMDSIILEIGVHK